MARVLANPKPVVTRSAAAAKRVTVFMREPYLNGYALKMEVLELGTECRVLSAPPRLHRRS